MEITEEKIKYIALKFPSFFKNAREINQTLKDLHENEKIIKEICLSDEINERIEKIDDQCRAYQKESLYEIRRALWRKYYGH